MKKVIKLDAIPEKSVILNGFKKVDYSDTYSIQKKTDKPIEEISKELMRLPGWAAVLLRLRNSIVKVFGLKTDKQEGDHDTFFTLIEKNEDEIVMGEPDKHLDFKASIMRNKSEQTIFLTTVVHYNNVWGKIYFFLIKPFHKMIMKALLKRYLIVKE